MESAVWQTGYADNQGLIAWKGRSDETLFVIHGNDDSSVVGHQFIHLRNHVPVCSEDDNPLIDDALGQMQGLVTATATINYDTTTGTMITIPAGSIIRKCYFRVGATSFDGTFTVDFGNGTDADGYLATANITEGTTGLYGINEDDRGALLWDGTLQIGDYSASAITVVATIVGGSATQGSGVLYIQYERVH